MVCLQVSVCPVGRILLVSVADPGFSVGGGGVGANLQRGYSLAKMYAKTKELDPVGGGCAPAAPPPLDPPMSIHVERR